MVRDFIAEHKVAKEKARKEERLAREKEVQERKRQRENEEESRHKRTIFLPSFPCCRSPSRQQYRTTSFNTAMSVNTGLLKCQASDHFKHIARERPVHILTHQESHQVNEAARVENTTTHNVEVERSAVMYAQEQHDIAGQHAIAFHDDGWTEEQRVQYGDSEDDCIVDNDTNNVQDDFYFNPANYSHGACHYDFSIGALLCRICKYLQVRHVR